MKAKEAILRVVENLKGEVEAIEVETIDVTQRSELATRYMAMSTPAIAINGELAFVGVPKEEALVKRLRGSRG